jgi:hypothetical protein
MKRNFFFLVIALGVMMVLLLAATTIDNFFMPGSQPGQSGNIETPDKCDNCHGGYDAAVEPAFNWRGGMMSQAARDPLYLACLAIAEQDAPGSGDLCIRCHAPDGWLNGRSTPTDGSALNNNDRQGVQCDFCHKLVKPTPIGTNPYPNDAAYTSGTYPRDQAYLNTLALIPGSSSNGMYIADSENAKRGPYNDATGRHQMYYSPFHRSSDICGTCHDVSNPAFTRPNTTTATYTFNGTGFQSPTHDLRLMFPVERTYSEWTKSDYADPSWSGARTCQKCHMKPVTGKGAKMKDAVVRTDLALHDMTGGNTFIPDLVKQLFPGEVNAAALDAGKLRADSTLRAAADLDLIHDAASNTLTVKVTNKTGHKLPSGYPEGRRIWVNVQCYGPNGILAEYGAYDNTTAVLTTTNTKVYEIKPGLSTAWAATAGKTAGPSFHFAINDMIYSDNRIPPRGVTNAELDEIQSPTINYTYADGQYWDNTTYTLPAGTGYAEVKLYYQTVSKEYVEFLHTANTTNNAGLTLYNLWAANGKSAPVVMKSATWGNPPAPPTPMMAISNCNVTRVTKPGNNIAGRATFTVVEAGTNTPVAGATVTASYVGPNAGNVSGTTNSSGVVILETANKKNPSGTWCFFVTNITKTGYAYTIPSPLFSCCEPSAKLGNETATLSVSIYPNPVAGAATITVNLPQVSEASIEVYDVTGKKVETISNTTLSSGEHHFIWQTAALQRGIYFIRLTAGTGTQTVKVVVRS